MAHGFILFAHGSRDPLWHLPMEAVAHCIRQREPGAQVACAYLELSQPDLPRCAADLIAGGAEAIRIVPMFLGVGKHAREDLPLLVESLRKTYPQVQFELQKAVGEDARLVETLAHIALS